MILNRKDGYYFYKCKLRWCDLFAKMIFFSFKYRFHIPYSWNSNSKVIEETRVAKNLFFLPIPRSYRGGRVVQKIVLFELQLYSKSIPSDFIISTKYIDNFNVKERKYCKLNWILVMVKLLKTQINHSI